MKHFRLYFYLVLTLCVSSIHAQENDSAHASKDAHLSMIGESMPDAILQDTLKQPHHLSDYLGKYVLVNFWALTCRYCIEAMPELKKIAEMYGDQITFVSINTDPHRFSFRKGTAVKQIPWASLWDNGRSFEGLMSQFKLGGLPAFVWISPEGKIQDLWMGYGEGLLLSRVEELLKEK